MHGDRAVRKLLDVFGGASFEAKQAARPRLLAPDTRGPIPEAPGQKAFTRKRFDPGDAAFMPSQYQQRGTVLTPYPGGVVGACGGDAPIGPLRALISGHLMTV